MSSTRDLSIEEVCAKIGVSIRTLRTLIQTGQAPPSYKLSRRRLFPEAELERWLAEQRAGAR
jgi:excisionase family DNA binding protein